MASIGISDVVITSGILGENPSEEVMMMKMIMNKSQETTVFHGRQKLSSAMKQRKVMVDFKFNALYR